MTVGRAISSSHRGAGTLILDRYEPDERSFEGDGRGHVLNDGRYGPVLRVRDVRKNRESNPVVIKIFNAAEAFYAGKMKECRDLSEAQKSVLGAYKAEVCTPVHFHLGGPIRRLTWVGVVRGPTKCATWSGRPARCALLRLWLNWRSRLSP